MRASVASISTRLLSIFFVIALIVGALPIAAFADAEAFSDVADIRSVSEGSAEAGASLDGDVNARAYDATGSSASEQADAIINQEVALSTVAQAESTRDFILAKTLEATKTVPVVKAKLSVEQDDVDEVVGSFEREGIVYAIEPGGESVLVAAIDQRKLPMGSQAIVIPAEVFADGVDRYAVARIAEGALSGTREIAVAKAEDAKEDERASVARAESEADADRSDAVATVLDTIMIPASVTTIENGALSGADMLQSIVVDNGNPNYSSFDGCLYDANLTSLLLIPEGRVGAVRIAPSAIDIDPEVFSHCPSVDEIIADTDSAAFTSVDGCLYRKDTNELVFEPALNEEQEAMLFSPARASGSSAEVTDTEIDAKDAAARDVATGTLSISGNGGEIKFYVGENALFGPYDNWVDAWADHWSLFNSAGAIHYYTTGWDLVQLWVSRAGYTFSSWSGTSGDYTGTSDLSVSAIWSPNAYHVSLDGQGATSAGTTLLTVYMDTALPAATPPARSGYTFDGYYTSVNGSGDKWIDSAGRNVLGTFRAAKDMTLYAKWIPNTYAVSFNANGGSGGQSANVTATYDAAMPAISTAKPVRAGYAFSGWYDTNASSGGTQYYTASCASARTWNKTGPATLYARWAPVTYGISYDDVGGSFTGKTGSYTIESNDFALPASGMRTGFTFAGWKVTGASGSGIEGNGTTSVTVKKGTYGNLAAKAIWTINVYHLSWSVSHGTHANRTEDFTVEDCPIAMGGATPDAGYAFLGWSGTGIAEGSASFALTDSMLEGRGDGETFAYVASFAANPYTARLHANDGTGEGGLGDTVEHAVTYDAPVSPASVPKRYGYAFSGYWTKGADGSKEELYFDEDGSYVRDDVWKDPSDVDLYACWTLMANLEVPVNAPSAVSFTVDRALEIGEDATGTQAGPSVTGALRSSVPQEVPIASIELEPLQDADGTASASRVLGEGNPERCAVEVSLGSSSSALLRLADATGAPLRWEPPSPLAIPAAVPVASGTTGEDVTSDSSGNLARLGELPLSYAMRLFPGFDVYRMPAEDASSEPVARIVFTVDLTGLEREEF